MHNMSFLHFCQVGCVHAIPALIPGGVCVCAVPSLLADSLKNYPSKTSTQFH